MVGPMQPFLKSHLSQHDIWNNEKFHNYPKTRNSHLIKLFYTSEILSSKFKLRHPKFKLRNPEFQISNFDFQFSNYVISIHFQLSKSQSLTQILTQTLTLTQNHTLTLILTLVSPYNNIATLLLKFWTLIFLFQTVEFWNFEFWNVLLTSGFRKKSKCNKITRKIVLIFQNYIVCMAS